MSPTHINFFLHGVFALSACNASLVLGQQDQSLLTAGYPSKPIRILVGTSPGGGIDIIARGLGQKLTERWGRSVVVDNRTGGGGVIALELLAQTAPDGYTLYGGGGQLVTATPLKKVRFDTRKAFDAVAQLTTQSYLFVVAPSVSFKSVKELIAYAKSKPGTLSYGSAGIGSATHLGTELFKSMAGGVDIVHVPYRGNGQALIDLMGGHTQMQFASTISATPHVRAGKLVAIAITSRQRLRAFSDLPTVAESGVPGFELDNMYGLYAPAGVPPAILSTLNKEVVQIMNSPEMKDKLAADGAEVAPAASPAAFKIRFSQQVDMWERFIKTSAIKLE